MNDGVIDEIRLIGKEEEKEVTVFLTRAMGKGLVAKAAIEAGESPVFTFAGKDSVLSIHDGASSGGGRASGTAAKEGAKKAGRGGRGGGDAGGRGGRGGSSSGCFNCGEDGHRAADCPTAAAGGAARGGRGGARGGRGGGQ